MVGVPGRSRGCLTCRARKKGCDQQRPICGQCRRSNIVCRGYANSLTFVRYHPEQVGASHFSAAQDGTVSGQPQPQTPVTIGSQVLIRIASEGQLFDTYWEDFFPKRNVAQSFVYNSLQSKSVPGSWAFVIRDQCAENRLIRLGLLAVAYGSVGRRNDERRFAVAGMQAYSAALKEVNQSLQHSEKRKADSVLAACKLLALYEASGGSGEASHAFNWERHTLGVLRLLELRGASSHSKELAHNLFLDARYQGIVACIRRRVPFYLSSPEWRELPWLNRHKDFKQELLDVMTQIPAIFAEYDKRVASKGTPADTPYLRLRFYNVCNRFYQEVDSWFRKLRSQVKPELLMAVENGIPEAFPISQLLLAQTMTLYWATSVLLSITVCMAFEELPVAGSCIQLEELKTIYNPRLHAFNIARSSNYFFSPAAGSISSQAFSFPLGVAFHYISYENLYQSDEYRQMTQGFGKGKTGEMIKKFLVSLLRIDSDRQAQEKEISERGTIINIESVE